MKLVSIVADELPGLGAGRRVAHPVDDVVEPALEQLEQVLAGVAATAFGSPRRTPRVADLVTASDTIDEFEAIDEVDPEPNQSGARSDDRLRERARSLMSELQDVIEGLTGESPSASGDLADELEISLTRPAALDGEALSDLRTVAESAQERPRDLDTLTALTAQAGAIVALIVGYERATAGIEMSRLMIAPEHGGQGHGRRLWDYAVATVRELGAPVMTFDAEHFAEPFYHRMGAETIGELDLVPPNMPDWRVKVMRYVIAPESS